METVTNAAQGLNRALFGEKPADAPHPQPATERTESPDAKRHDTQRQPRLEHTSTTPYTAGRTSELSSPENAKTGSTAAVGGTGLEKPVATENRKDDGGSSSAAKTKSEYTPASTGEIQQGFGFAASCDNHPDVGDLDPPISPKSVPQKVPGAGLGSESVGLDKELDRANSAYDTELNNPTTYNSLSSPEAPSPHSDLSRRSLPTYRDPPDNAGTNPVHGSLPRSKTWTQRVGVPSSGEHGQAGQSRAKPVISASDIPAQSAGVGGPGAAAEPSVSSSPGSAQQRTDKQEKADKPPEEPSMVETVEESGEGEREAEDEKGRHQSQKSMVGGHPENEGIQEGPYGLPREKSGQEVIGKKYKMSTGMAADGGDFDAASPGAGREADRLLEQKGIHRDTNAGRTTATHVKSGIHRKHQSERREAPEHSSNGEKRGLGGKIKDKLHMGHHGK